MKSCLRVYISLDAQCPNRRLPECHKFRYGTDPKYATLQKLKLSAISLEVSGGYAVKDREGTNSVNVLVTQVDWRYPSEPRANLHLVKHVWNTHLFSFYKLATLIIPSLERVPYIKDPNAESDGCLTPSCADCRPSSTSTEKGRNAPVMLTPCATALYVSGNAY
jgi:hypothetical protein